MVGEEEGKPNFFLHILSSLVIVRLHTENGICNLPGSALKVPVVGGWVVVVESEYSDRLWLVFSLALAKPNKIRHDKTGTVILSSDQKETWDF